MILGFENVVKQMKIIVYARDGEKAPYPLTFLAGILNDCSTGRRCAFAGGSEFRCQFTYFQDNHHFSAELSFIG